MQLTSLFHRKFYKQTEHLCEQYIKTDPIPYASGNSPFAI